MQTPTVAKNMVVDARLAEAGQAVTSVATIQSAGRISVAGAQRIYLRMYAGQVVSMIREGADLLVIGPDGEMIRLAGFYDGNTQDGQPRQLLLMDGEGGLVVMETSRAITDGPMPVYSTGVIEPSPFPGLTADNDDGGGMGLVVPVLAGGGIMAAIIGLFSGNGGKKKWSGEDPAPQPPASTLGKPVVSVLEAAADGGLSLSQLEDGSAARVRLPEGAAAGNRVVLRITADGVTREVQQTLTEQDIRNGYADVEMGLDAGRIAQYVLDAIIIGAGGNSPPSDPVSIYTSAIIIPVQGDGFANVDEMDSAAVATGTLLLASQTPTSTLTLSAPTQTFTSGGQPITWQTLPNGSLVGSAGGRVIVTIALANDGQYRVELSGGIDHPADAASLNIPVGVTFKDGATTTASNLNVVVQDGAPQMAAPVNLSPTAPGLIVGTLVENMGLDGGRITSITIDGMTFTDGVASGTSASILAYEIADDKLFVTTVRGESVTVDLLTGAYTIQVTGLEAQQPGTNDPYAGLTGAGGLLGLVNANVLGLLELEKKQFFTASDADNDLVSVSVTYTNLVNLLGLTMNYDVDLARELGIDVSVATTGVIFTNNTLVFTATDGGTLDNWKINELLATITVLGPLSEIVNLEVGTSFAITAVDANGGTVTVEDASLVSLGIASGLIGSLTPSPTYQGGTGNDTYSVPAGPGGVDADSRLYGYDGNDTLTGGNGNDILRGGAGDDVLNGGAGSDVLIGGTGVDTLTGGDGVDVFRFEKGDEFGLGTTQRDVITDFNVAALAAGGDVLDLADMLQGEGRLGNTAGNLSRYLHFEYTAEGTVIHISTTGGYAGGFNATTASTTDHRILLSNVDLTNGSSSDIEIINDLLSRGKLMVDVAETTNPPSSGNLQIEGTATDGDGDRGSSTVVVDDAGLGDPANNTGPEVGASAENVLGLIGGNLAGLSLSTQDLLVADADNNLSRVTLEYAPLLSVALSPLSFGYDAALANALGYDVRVINSPGLLGLVAPSSRIEITSRTGEPLDNTEINAFLATVYLVDDQGGLLSSSLLNATVLESIVLTAEDVWGASNSAALDTFLSANALNTIGGGGGLLGGMGLRMAMMDLPFEQELDLSSPDSTINTLLAQAQSLLADGLDESDITTLADQIGAALEGPLAGAELDRVTGLLDGALQGLASEGDIAGLLDGVSDLLSDDLMSGLGFGDNELTDLTDQIASLLQSGYLDSQIEALAGDVQTLLMNSTAFTSLEDLLDGVSDQLEGQFTDAELGNFLSMLGEQLGLPQTAAMRTFGDFDAEQWLEDDSGGWMDGGSPDALAPQNTAFSPEFTPDSGIPDGSPLLPEGDDMYV